MKKQIPKGSFNYSSIEQKTQFLNKAKAEGKTITTVLNQLIDQYLQNKLELDNAE